MQQIYAYNGITPVVPISCYVHETAVIIGDVILSENCYVGPCAVLRGDFGRIHISNGSNVQETCVIHSFPNQDVILEENSHIGHGAVLHGCHIGQNVLVGMNSVVMDKAYIGDNCIIGALSFIKAGEQFESGHMIAGSPARIIRELDQDEIEWKRDGTGVYQTLTVQAGQTIQKTTALTEVEPNRPAIPAPEYTLKNLTGNNKSPQK